MKPEERIQKYVFIEKKPETDPRRMSETELTDAIAGILKDWSAVKLPFAHCLNAMAHAESFLTDDQQIEYMVHLEENHQIALYLARNRTDRPEWEDVSLDFRMYNLFLLATACPKLRAIAFLRTVMGAKFDER